MNLHCVCTGILKCECGFVPLQPTLFSSAFPQQATLSDRDCQYPIPQARSIPKRRKTFQRFKGNCLKYVMPVFDIKAEAYRDGIDQPFVTVQQLYPRLLVAVHTLAHKSTVGYAGCRQSIHSSRCGVIWRLREATSSHPRSAPLPVL